MPQDADSQSGPVVIIKSLGVEKKGVGCNLTYRLINMVLKKHSVHQCSLSNARTGQQGNKPVIDTHH